MMITGANRLMAAVVMVTRYKILRGFFCTCVMFIFNHRVATGGPKKATAAAAVPVVFPLFVLRAGGLLKLMRFSSQLSRNSTPTVGQRHQSGEKQLVSELTVGRLFIFSRS